MFYQGEASPPAHDEPLNYTPVFLSPSVWTIKLYASVFVTLSLNH